jgi:hypothetical protein
MESLRGVTVCYKRGTPGVQLGSNGWSSLIACAGQDAEDSDPETLKPSPGLLNHSKRPGLQRTFYITQLKARGPS